MSSFGLLIVFCLIWRPIDGQKYINSLEMSKKDIQLNVDESDSFDVFVQKQTLSQALEVMVSCDGHCKTMPAFAAQTVLFGPNATRFRFNVTAATAGHDVIIARLVAQNTSIDAGDAFVRVRVGHSQVWVVLKDAVGWIYFVVWSASFWPQNVVNFRRKSVVGYSLDFAALNVTGFLFYAIYNSGLYFSARIQTQYERRFPRSEIPVELNDVVYALHAALATAITLVQCYVYERGDQRMSWAGVGFTGVVWTAAGVQLVLALVGVESWLTFMYFFSYVKLVVTSTKYIPQAWFNYKRKSTRGWSIWMIYMDFVGGANGLLQMLFLAYNYDDWTTIFGNFAKFGLSLASISYDILFFLQEYVFYRKQRSSLRPPNREKAFAASERKASRVSVVSLRSDNGRYPAVGRHDGPRKSVLSVKSVESLKSVFNY